MNFEGANKENKLVLAESRPQKDLSVLCYAIVSSLKLRPLFHLKNKKICWRLADIQMMLKLSNII